MENQEAFLLRKAKDFVENVLWDREKFPLITLTGSLGSPFATVHKKSDIDIETFIINFTGEFPEEALLEPKGFKLRHTVRRNFLKVDIFNSVEENYQVDVSYPLSSAHELKNLLQINDSDILSNITRYVDRFVESHVLRDDYRIFMPLQKRIKELFLANRYEFLKKVVPALYRNGSKIRADWEMALVKEIVDMDYYNQNRQQYIATLIFLDALISGVIISENSVCYRRRSNLEKILGIDQSLLRATIARNEEDLRNHAKSSLQILAKSIYEKAIKNAPNVNWGNYSSLFFQEKKQ